MGELVTEEGTGRLCCHLCGDWFRSLGSHVRAHGHTAESYRAELGLCRGEPLTQARLSAAISVRQQAAYEASESVRAHLMVGQESARTGTLSKAATDARSETPLSTGAQARQAIALDAGRRTVASRRDAALRRLLETAGSPDLASYLRDRYDQGASLAQLATETGLGRSRLGDEIRAAGITTRSAGQNTTGGRRSRALLADIAAAQRVGTDDLEAWLHTRRNQGWSLTALGAAVGHSSHWVKWRLQPAPDASDDRHE